MKKIWLGALLAACAALLLPGCGKPRVEVAAAVKTSAPFVFETEARAEALYTLPVTPRVSGAVVSALPEAGREVRAGEILLQIDASRYEAQAAALRARMAAPAAALPADDSMEASLLSQGIITRAEYERLRGRRAQPASSGNEADREALLAMQRAIDDCTVVAPIDGVIAKIYIDETKTVAAGKPALLLRQSTPVICAVEIPASADALLQEAKDGRTLTVTLSAEDGSRTWYGELKRQAEEGGGDSLYKVQADNPDGAIAIGETYRVRIDSGKPVEGYVLPDSAFVTPTQVEIVTQDHLVDVRDVTVAYDMGDSRLVLSGLTDGDRVILSPDASLSVGTEVDVKEIDVRREVKSEK